MNNWRKSRPPGARQLPPGQPVTGPIQTTRNSPPTIGARPLSAYVGNAAVHETTATSQLPVRVRAALVTLVGMNIVYLLVMMFIPSTESLGPFASFITWGGHQWAPLLLALLATAGLTTVAFMSAGYTEANRNHLVTLWICVAASIVSTGLAVASLAVIAVLLLVGCAVLMLMIGGLLSE